MQPKTVIQWVALIIGAGIFLNVIGHNQSQWNTVVGQTSNSFWNVFLPPVIFGFLGPALAYGVGLGLLILVGMIGYKIWKHKPPERLHRNPPRPLPPPPREQKRLPWE